MHASLLKLNQNTTRLWKSPKEARLTFIDKLHVYNAHILLYTQVPTSKVL